MLVVGWIDCLCFGKGCISMAYLMIMERLASRVHSMMDEKLHVLL